jgi:hypothetical protein
MTSHSGPIYEVTFFVAPDIAEDCERRIEEHVRSVLLDPAVTDATVFAKENDNEGRLQRVCVHNLAGDEALDEFIDGPASELEARLYAEFGEQLEIQSRVLREDQLSSAMPQALTNCLNCGARLRGQYCGVCGQRSRSRLISLWELISDAFGDLLEIDSRLWQTLIPLLIRPGKLTFDYLQGKRARFMPPFRMYLVLSLLFFVVAFFDPREELGLLFEPEPEVTAEEEATATNEAAEEAAEAAQERIDELIEEGIISEEDLSPEFKVDEDGFRFTFDGEESEAEGNCEFDETDGEDLPEWIARRLTPERMQRICERTEVDGGSALIEKLLDNIPAALIVLLPLMAFVLKALYPLSKRYYVEHLLFFVHFHSFFFLILTLQILLIRVGYATSIPEAIPILIVVALSLYIAAYLFVSMRKVYGQGRIITFLKYIILLVAYSFGFTMTMLAALAIAAFSI